MKITITDAGNGFPQVGELVLGEWDGAVAPVLRIKKVGRIQTEQFEANWADGEAEEIGDTMDPAYDEETSTYDGEEVSEYYHIQEAPERKETSGWVTYKVELPYDSFEFEANMDQASAPIRMDGEDTQFQTADARHDPEVAALLLLHSFGSDYWLDPDEDTSDWDEEDEKLYVSEQIISVEPVSNEYEESASGRKSFRQYFEEMKPMAYTTPVKLNKTSAAKLKNEIIAERLVPEEEWDNFFAMVSKGGFSVKDLVGVTNNRGTTMFRDHKSDTEVRYLVKTAEKGKLNFFQILSGPGASDDVYVGTLESMLNVVDSMAPKGYTEGESHDIKELSKSEMQAIVRRVKKFTVPPEYADEPIEISYGIDPETKYIVERIYDRKDREVSYTFYDNPDVTGDFDPHNDVPQLGDELGHFKSNERLANA